MKEDSKSESGLKSIARSIKHKIFPPKTTKKNFTTSEDYWNDRYETGGNSGAGSYSNLAEFKAEILNEFVKKNEIETVIELGSGDGNQLEYFNFPKYLGFDISDFILNKCREKFKGDASKEFYQMNEIESHSAPLSLSLDVIYHLVEDSVFEIYMNQLFNCSTSFVIIYASNEKDDGTFAAHVKPRKFTDWVEANQTGFILQEKIPNKFQFTEGDEESTSFADFYIYKKK